MKQQESKVNYEQDFTMVNKYIYKMAENSKHKELAPVPWRMIANTVISPFHIKQITATQQ